MKQCNRSWGFVLKVLGNRQHWRNLVHNMISDPYHRGRNATTTMKIIHAWGTTLIIPVRLPWKQTDRPCDITCFYGGSNSNKRSSCDWSTLYL